MEYRCKFCGRKLTNIVSVNRGYGEECARKHIHRITLLEAIAQNREKAKKREAMLDDILITLYKQLSQGNSRVIKLGKEQLRVLEETRIKLIFERDFNIRLVEGEN